MNSHITSFLEAICMLSLWFSASTPPSPGVSLDHSAFGLPWVGYWCRLKCCASVWHTEILPTPGSTSWRGKELLCIGVSQCFGLIFGHSTLFWLYRRHLEICRPNHHGCGLERVAGPLPVVPLDTVELICALLLWIVLSVQVGRTTCIKPPSCESETEGVRSGWWHLCQPREEGSGVLISFQLQRRCIHTCAVTLSLLHVFLHTF